LDVGKEGTWSESGEDERENDEENDDEDERENDNEHINIEDLVIYEDDSDETIDSKMKNLIQLSKNYEFSFPCVKLNKRQRCLIHQTVGTHFYHFTTEGILYLSKRKQQKPLFDKYNEEKKSLENRVDDKLDKLNSQINNLPLSNVKTKKVLLEKASLSAIQVSSESKEKVKNRLKKSSNVILCTKCDSEGVEKFCNGDFGLKIHTRAHKDLNK
jgi:hypothetical protein